MSGTTVRNNHAGRILGKIQQATARALTRSMQTARAHATREVAAELGTSQAPIRERLILERARGDRLEVSLRFTGKRLRLTDLGARQTRAGVSYRTRGGRAIAPGAFLATMRSGHTGAFKRKSQTRSRAGKPRSSPELPIVELYGASVPFVATKRQILESTLKAAVAAFEKNQAHELAFALGGAK